MRDLKGRFVRGHTPITNRDLSTGRFIAKDKAEFLDKYVKARVEIDMFLKGKYADD